jgi:hypothetical protein
MIHSRTWIFFLKGSREKSKSKSIASEKEAKEIFCESFQVILDVVDGAKNWRKATEIEKVAADIETGAQVEVEVEAEVEVEIEAKAEVEVEVGIEAPVAVEVEVGAEAAEVQATAHDEAARAEIRFEVEAEREVKVGAKVEVPN